MSSRGARTLVEGECVLWKSFNFYLLFDLLVQGVKFVDGPANMFELCPSVAFAPPVISTKMRDQIRRRIQHLHGNSLAYWCEQMGVSRNMYKWNLCIAGAVGVVGGVITQLGRDRNLTMPVARHYGALVITALGRAAPATVAVIKRM